MAQKTGRPWVKWRFTTPDRARQIRIFNGKNGLFSAILRN
jgi:hypothetical protein